MFLNKDLGANNIGSLDCRGHLVAFSSAKEFLSVKKIGLTLKLLCDA